MTQTKFIKALRTIAMRHPEVEEGIACKGTAIECSAFKARKKTFLFLSAANLRLKLHDSVPEATKFATEEPDVYEVGAGGWIKVTFSDEHTPPTDLLERWIDESYRLLVPAKKKKAAK